MHLQRSLWSFENETQRLGQHFAATEYTVSLEGQHTS